MPEHKKDTLNKSFFMYFEQNKMNKNVAVAVLYMLKRLLDADINKI